jgi:hypothetical protein
VQHEKKELPPRNQPARRIPTWQHEFRPQHLESTIATFKKFYYNIMGLAAPASLTAGMELATARAEHATSLVRRHP